MSDYPPLPVTYPTQRHPGALWLVSRVPRPREIHEAWADGRSPAIEIGRRFDVVHLAAEAVEGGIAGVRTDDVVEAAFREAGIGYGVVVTRRRDVYSVLVRAGTARTWTAGNGTRAVGIDDHLRYLRTPHPGRREGPGDFWLLPVPHEEEVLAGAVEVRALLARSGWRSGRAGTCVTWGMRPGSA
ncbi:hypothetical protein [Streptomyces huiliensis]|uniref:hypothetical protein n=1 Tax=Streptomyces huiliensis TaxID=2876027 RepID=UPI001CBFA294|nr:hypothetical protein [Streptomyces huiliensis]MBZ4318089.1 hypothetical protein [Streptomyces huiliensis]